MILSGKYKLPAFYFKLIEIVEGWALPILILVIRVWMGRIFWYSGLTKLNSIDNTLDLFKYEYKVPFISPFLATYLSMFIELSMPILLFIGLGTRIATIPLISMTLIIQFTYLALDLHIYWIFLLCIIAFYGPGKLSLDHLIAKKIKFNFNI